MKTYYMNGQTVYLADDVDKEMVDLKKRGCGMNDNTITLNINDYISDYDMKEMIRLEVVRALRTKINAEADRLLGNLSHYQAQAIVDELLTEEQRELVKTKTLAIINDLGTYTVFHTDYRGQGNNAVYQLNQAVSENVSLIKDKVKEVIDNYPYADKLEDDCLGVLHDAIIKKLSKKDKE